MKDTTTPTYDDWSYNFTCKRCETEGVGEAEDLHTAMFKTSGYHFAGTAVSDRAFYIMCPNPNCVSYPYLFVPADQIPAGLQLQTIALRDDDD